MVQATLAQASGKRPTTAHIVETIVRTLSVLAEPGQVIELRVPGVQGKRTDSGYFTDPEKLARAAVSYIGRAEGIYITLNPLNPALLARSSNRITEYAKTTTGDKDVTCRRWLFIDFDAIRPAGISSSEVEHEAALTRAIACRTWLQARDVCSVFADSGNGAHVLIPVNLPNTDENTALLKRVLSSLSVQFSDEQVQIDTSTVNASRIIKLYGTLACKGDNVPDRPHRQAVLLEVPEQWTPIALSALESLAALVDENQPTASTKTVTPLKKASTPSTDANRAVIDEIKAKFDLVAYAEGKLGVMAVQQGRDYRLPGHQGFLINPEKACWFHHGGQYGGDALDLVGYLSYESAWNRQDSTHFKAVLREAAEVTGVTLPKRTTKKRKAAKDDTSTTETSQTPSAPTAKIDLMDVAQTWKQRYTNALAWDAKATVWRRWSGTHWQAEPEKETFDLVAVDVMRSLGLSISNAGNLDLVIRLARALCKQHFAPTRRLINFSNGTLDLSTMVGHLHTPDDGLTECLPYDYAPKERCTTIETFLKNAIPDAEGQRAYMTHLGLALVGDVTFHKALVLIGPPRSGKTTLLRLAQLVLGGTPGQFPTAVLFSSESRGANSRAAWIDQSPRLVCLDEFPEEALRDEGEDLFKSMTAHGGVSMWLKYRNERPENLWTAKLLFATNNKMRYRDPSGALTRRLLILECPNSLPDERLDGSLLDKFRPELGAFAAACIQLALQAQHSRIYPESAAMRALLTDIERNGDAVKLWVSENCICTPNVFTPTKMLYANFTGWCAENGLHSVSRPKLRDVLCGYHIGIHCTKQRATDPTSGVVRPQWGMVGLRLRSAADDLSE